MDDKIIAALIGLVGIVVGAILKEVLPNSKLVNWLSGKPTRHNLTGEWVSSWGPLPNGPVKYQEVLEIERQRGDKVWGKITKNDEPEKNGNLRDGMMEVSCNFIISPLQMRKIQIL